MKNALSNDVQQELPVLFCDTRGRGFTDVFNNHSGRGIRDFLCLLTVVTVFVCLPLAAQAQWAAQSGQTVRNAFGPGQSQGVHMCRGEL